MLSTLNRSLLSTARMSGRKIAIATTRSLSTSTSTVESEPTDAMDIFDSIDTNGDGVLSKEEFQIAVEKMH